MYTRHFVIIAFAVLSLFNTQVSSGQSTGDSEASGPPSSTPYETSQNAAARSVWLERYSSEVALLW
jgi:hypothetical protein